MEDSRHIDIGRDDRLSASRPPGVYYELFFERKVQPVFRTAVPVFVGFATRLGREALHAPRIYHLDRWAQFQHFQTDPKSYLGHAVRGFFENGGEHCVVAPVEGTRQGAMAAALINIFTPGNVLDDLEDIDLICVPDAMLPDILSSRKVLDVQFAVLEHCQRMGDRFAILDGFPRDHTPMPAPSVQDKPGAMSHWQQLPPEYSLPREYGALYYPWISVKELSSYTGEPHPSRKGMPCDEYDRTSKQGKPDNGLLQIQPARLVPPCGHIAGIYSRSDRRIGVHKAPANELIEDVLKLEIDFSDDDQAALNDAGINCLRTIRGGGIRVWGARTLSGQPQWSYVNVRRLFLTLTRWIRKNMNDVVYESNDPYLWNRIRQRLGDYCRNLYDQGALRGDSPEQAFYIKCDAETNSREHWEAGEVITEVGLAPSVPTEFIVVRITQNASTTTVSGLNPL